MRLLAATLPRFRRLVPSGHGLVTLTFVGLLIGLELIGRLAGSDLHDGLAGLVLASAVALVAARHRRYPLPWVNWLGGRLGRLAGRLDRVRYDHGIDLRGTPRLPRKLPPIVWGLLAALVGWAALAGLAWLLFPGGWREVGTHTSYVLYLVALLAVWAGLLVCTFAGVYVPVLLFDRRLKGAVRSADRKGVELALLAGYGLSVAAVAYLVPTAVVLGLCLAVASLAAALVVRAGADEPAILWRRGPEAPIFAVPLRRIVAGGLGLLALVVFDLLLTACGGRLLTPPDPSDAMPVTALLGTTAAWMVPGLVAVLGLRLWAGRRTDPARRTAPTAHLRSDLPAAELGQAAAAVARWGWDVRLAPAASQPGDVTLELVPADRSEATEFEPRWPLKVADDDLVSCPVRERVERRDQIQLRRQAIRGLATLFKKAAADRGPRGGGYWFAPHWWFITGLDREDPHAGRKDQPTPPRPVGPPFHRVFGPRVRQHFHAVFRAVEVDMVFVEDGVGHRTVEKVLRVLFELYDVHAGRRRAEDHLFRGLPKVRVMVHDYAPGRPFKTDRYREPQFDDLSRARVLHIFRDTGGHEAPTEAPFDISWEPSPALGVG
jgi:hypothetical protein